MEFKIWDLIRPMIAAGKTNEQIASELNTLGHKRADGKRFFNTDISVIAIANGVRRKRAYTHKAKQLPLADATKEPSLADDVLQVMTVALPERLQMKIVRLLTSEAKA